MHKFLTLVLFLLSLQLEALVPKKLLVEHFTNTYCSVCASRNPGFRSNLNMQAEVVYISYHPSSPYPSCLFNQANKAGNDGRTNHYGVYGSTPRLVINQQVIPVGADYSNSALFAPHLNTNSSFEVRISQLKTGDEMKIRIALIKKDTFSGLANARLFVAAAEDTIAYTAPNGEKDHFRVFRKEAGSVAGNPVILPSAIGDSTVYHYTLALNQTWNTERMAAIAILSDLNGNYLQAEETAAQSEDQTLNLYPETVLQHLRLFPLPAKNSIRINGIEALANPTFHVLNAMGQLLATKSSDASGLIDIADLESGLYYLRIANQDQVIHLPFIKAE